MNQYRLYFFDGLDHARHAVDIYCRDDQAALKQAAALAGDYPASELWRNDRMIGRLERAEAA